MNPSERDEEKIGRSARDDEEKKNAESAENREPAELEADKEKTEVVTKEAMLRVTGGQL